jgi:hypothetical protein
MPGDIVSEGSLARPATILVELVAERRVAGKDAELDPWFLRRSPPFTIEIAEPFVDWRTQDREVTRLWGRATAVPFGAVLAAPRPGAPVFAVPPRLGVAIERFDEDLQVYSPLGRDVVEGNPDGQARTYLIERTLPGNGEYRYQYRLEGTTASGPFAIASPLYTFRVGYPWTGAGLVTLGVLCLVWLALWRLGPGLSLRGTVRLLEPEMCQHRLAGKEFESGVLQRKSDGALGSAHAFRLRARRSWSLRTRYLLGMVAGGATVFEINRVRGEEVRSPHGALDGGASTALARGKRYAMVFNRADGVPVEIEIDLRG